MDNVNIKFSLKKEWLAVLIFIFLAIVFYGGTLKNGFVYDDRPIIENNKYVQSLENLPRSIAGCLWEGTFKECKGRSIYYRPVQYLSYILTYQVSSKPWVFHLVNLAFFILVVSMVFFLARKITKNFISSFIAALIFLAHPLNSEVANWISATPELTFTLFVLASTFFYIKHREENKPGNFKLAALFYFLAVMSKEPAVLLPLAFVFLDIVFFKKNVADFLKVKEAKNYAVLAGLLAVSLALRANVLGSVVAFGNNPYTDLSASERIYSFFFLFGKYVQMMIYPYPLILFHYFDRSYNFLNYAFLANFATVAIFLLIAIYAYKKRNNALLFGQFWIFIFLLPPLIFLGSTGESVFAERYAFASVAGFSIIIGYFLGRLWAEKEKLKNWIAIALALVLCLSWYVAYNRNMVWKNDESLYTETLRQNPKATPIIFNYGVLLRDRRDFEKAKIEFEKILKNNPDWADITLVYLQLGDYYYGKGEEEKAVDYYQKSSGSTSTWKAHFGYNQLGVLYARKEKYFDALIYFCRSVYENPESEEGNANLERATSIVNDKRRSDSKWLYNEIFNSAILRKSEENKIKFADKTCDKDRCSYILSGEMSEKEYEVVLPFLVAAVTSSGEIVEIDNLSFNPAQNAIAAEINPKYQKEEIKFIIPSCKQVYYEVKTPVENQ